MSVVAYKLVAHDYDEESLSCIFSVNPINVGNSGFDYVYSIQNIENTRDEYGYCFINEKILDEGNYLYTLERFVLDSNLPESFVKKFVSTIIDYLNQIHREKIENAYRIDRIIGLGNPPLPLAPQFLVDTQGTISSAVVCSFIASRDGKIPLTNDEESRLKEIADKMNNTVD